MVRLSEFKDFREVRYPRLDQDNAATLLVIGNPEASRVMYMQAGFPDNQDAFVGIARRLAKHHDCLCGLGCMPEFDSIETEPLQRKEGYSFDETATCFAQGVAAVRRESTNPTAELVVCIHDWGVIPGIIHTNRALSDKVAPELRPAKLIVFDVLPNPKDADPTAGYTVAETLIHINYRACFAMSYVFHKRVSPFLGRWWLKSWSFLWFSLLGAFCNPAAESDNITARTFDTSIPKLCYPYARLFYEIAQNKGSLLTESDLPAGRLPILYIYGKDKNTRFHTQHGLDALDKDQDSSHVGVDDAGHWVYLQQEDKCMEHIASFL